MPWFPAKCEYVYAYTYARCVRCFLFSATTTKAATEAANLGPKLKDIGCRRPEDCSDVDGTYCDADLGFCLCKPDYPVTDTNHCYKGRDWA